MNDVTAMLHRAVDDEPPIGFVPDDLVVRGRRARRHRRALAGGAGALSLVLVAASYAAFARDDGTAATVAAPPGASAPAVPERVTEDNLAETVARQLGIAFRDVQVRERAGMLDLYGAIAEPAGDTVFRLHVFGADQPLKLAPLPTCESEPEMRGDDAECTTRTLADGTVLVVRTGRTPDGYVRHAAMLVRPDRSGMDVESTNAKPVDPSTCVTTPTDKRCAPATITRTDPAVPAEALADLLVALEPATR